MSTMTRRRKTEVQDARGNRPKKTGEPPTGVVYAFPTDLGWMAVIWGETGVRELAFNRKTPKEAIAALNAANDLPVIAESELPTKLARSVSLLQHYAAGKSVDLAKIPLELPSATVFHNSVITACRQIPRGEVLTYQQLAVLAGSPRAARAVGNVMRTNVIPLLIPCHRVVGAAGSLGGYSAPTGLTMKRRLLLLEGVPVSS